MEELNAYKHAGEVHWVGTLKIDHRSECDSKFVFPSLCGFAINCRLVQGVTAGIESSTPCDPECSSCGNRKWMDGIFYSVIAAQLHFLWPLSVMN